ncbi:MAG: hypothetical protein JWQ29_791 [Phenylobacterium sp.]|nr:hypothetical protein [Phenylobacterium sp.]
MRRSSLDLLSRHYGLVARDLFTPLLDVFGAARSAFDGDVERTVVLLEIAVRTVQDARFTGVDLDAVLNGEIEPFPALTINLRSIADSSGIPKETVRRKVVALVAQGLILRDGGNLSLSPTASQTLTPLREAIFKLAARNYETIAALQERGT